MKDLKDKYDKIEVPSKLYEQTINTIRKNKNRNKILKYITYGTVASIIALIIGVNTSNTFAQNISKIPILNKIINFVIINNDIKIDAKNKVDAKVVINEPIIEINDNNKLKNYIDVFIKGYKQDAIKSINEYKIAFIETGGTEEEFRNKNIQIEVNYKIFTANENYISFVLYGFEDWNSSIFKSIYYNMNTKTNKKITLKKLFGDNYINIISEEIKKQMKERTQKDENLTFFRFEKISSNQKFYINNKKNPVIIFDKYEIASGVKGIITFEINLNN